MHAKYQNSPWIEVRQIIQPNEPPLLGSEDLKEASQWLRDPFGREHPLPVEPSGARIRAPKELGAVQINQLVEPASGGAQPTPPATATRIKQIRDLNKFLSELTEGRLDLDKLASQIRLLSISPAWPSVDNAIRNFEAASPTPTGQPDPAILSHISLIESYGSMLDQAAGAIRRTLMIGTVMTLVMPGRSYARQLDRALRLLAADLRFAKLGLPEILVLLHAFDESVFGISTSLDLSIDKYFDVSDLDLHAWTSQLKSWTSDLSGRRDKFRLDLVDAVPQHHSRWRNFLIGRFRTGQPVFVPLLADLLLRATGMALAFNTDLSEMTYQDYAQVLLNLTVPLIPLSTDPLLLQCVLIDLGFAKQVADDLSSLPQVSAEALDLIEICKSHERNPTASERVLLVIGGQPEKRITSPDGDFIISDKKGTGSVTTAWRLSSQHSVLPVFALDMLAEMPFLPQFAFSVVLTEVSPLPFQPVLPTPPTQVRILPAGTTLSPSTPMDLVAPENLDAAIETVRKRIKDSTQPK